ncbi:hypothetical protein FYK55_07690 [Roseiconus nitratireducens]|uniref:Uncharacterized protein n=1 Tax=Roseiconus nitratireducens TaxID=2605748 RepID=A0A5M6DGI7_9BACT|nr:hypothetical protein [Roseiconus nitratireducens]KAA5545516.1 hypothetical protein FYK55_07690 [Roseiconus nitratireducens]
MTTAQWTTLRSQILADQAAHSPGHESGRRKRSGSEYLWGLASATGTPLEEDQVLLAKLASGAKLSPKERRRFDVPRALQRFQESLSGTLDDVGVATAAVTWAAAMPALLNHLDEHPWWDLLGALQELRDRLRDGQVADPMVLVGVAELGLTLSQRLTALPSCRGLHDDSIRRLRSWCEQTEAAVAIGLQQLSSIRLVLASLLRCREMLRGGQTPGKKKTKRGKSGRGSDAVWTAAHEAAVTEWTTWTIALMRRDGAMAFSPLSHDDLRDDLGKHGLLALAAAADEETLRPALDAALGRSRTKRRLAWQVHLPESMLHDEDSGVVCMLPEWDVRRGRTVIRYAGDETELEVTTGKAVLMQGAIETELRVNGNQIRSAGDWTATCEYTDDDVHYVELEQPWQAGYVVQRQFMLLREDRCGMIADAVTWRSSTNDSGPTDLSIEHRLRLPLGDGMTCRAEEQTTECFLCDDRPRAMVIPLSSNEWRGANSTTTLSGTADNHLLVASRGAGRLYVPLWIDLSRKRFGKKRTWRQLTVGEQLRLVPPRVAAAFRFQAGSEQWLLYRSMVGRLPRTFFGKHLIADFYAARFDVQEETYEDLITVEDSDDTDSSPQGSDVNVES